MAHGRSASRLVVGAAIVVVCLIALVVAIRTYGSARLQLIGQAGALPTSAKERGGAWYWIERPGGPNARLLRLQGSQPIAVAAADRVTGYDADANDVAWIAKQGSVWSVFAASAKGGATRALWSGPSEPHGVCLAGDNVYWLVPHLSATPDCGPLPPFGSSTDVLSEAKSGGASRLVGRLSASTGGQVLGVHGGAVYVSAYRGRGPGSTALYRIVPNALAPERLASETASQQALLTGDGTLYWLGPSREATTEAAVCSIHRLTPNGQPETMSDWVPAGGTLVETARGILYIDNEPKSGIWPVGAFLEVPQCTTCPQGYRAAAAGRTELLLYSTRTGPGPIPVYRTSLP